MKPSRLGKLERWARERPCPLCRRVPLLRVSSERASDLTRLSVEERAELAQLLHIAMTPRCARCGHGDQDIKRLTVEQRRRTLHLLRLVFARPHPVYEVLGTDGPGGCST